MWIFCYALFFIASFVVFSISRIIDSYISSLYDKAIKWREKINNILITSIIAPVILTILAIHGRVFC